MSFSSKVARPASFEPVRGRGDVVGGGDLDAEVDPAGQGVEAVRPIRDEIRARIRALLAELGIEAAQA